MTERFDTSPDGHRSRGRGSRVAMCLTGAGVLLAVGLTGCKSNTPAASKSPDSSRGVVLTNGATTNTPGARPRAKANAATPGDPPANPADPLGLKIRIDGRETNGQVMLTIFRAMCNRVVECGLPKPVESCMIDALEASCKDIRCDAPFAEDRHEYSECARAYATFACDKALAGVMPPSCPGND